MVLEEAKFYIDVIRKGATNFLEEALEVGTWKFHSFVMLPVVILSTIVMRSLWSSYKQKQENEIIIRELKKTIKSKNHAMFCNNLQIKYQHMLIKCFNRSEESKKRLNKDEVPSKGNSRTRIRLPLGASYKKKLRTGSMMFSTCPMYLSEQSTKKSKSTSGVIMKNQLPSSGLRKSIMTEGTVRNETRNILAHAGEKKRVSVHEMNKILSRGDLSNPDPRDMKVEANSLGIRSKSPLKVANKINESKGFMQPSPPRGKGIYLKNATTKRTNRYNVGRPSEGSSKEIQVYDRLYQRSIPVSHQEMRAQFPMSNLKTNKFYQEKKPSRIPCMDPLKLKRHSDQSEDRQVSCYTETASDEEDRAWKLAVTSEENKMLEWGEDEPGHSEMNHTREITRDQMKIAGRMEVLKCSKTQEAHDSQLQSQQSFESELNCQMRTTSSIHIVTNIASKEKLCHKSKVLRRPAIKNRIKK